MLLAYATRCAEVKTSGTKMLSALDQNTKVSFLHLCGYSLTYELCRPLVLAVQLL